MPEQKPSKREMGFYFALAQVGLEMVLPAVLGLVLDTYLGWTPWATITLVAVGFAGGLTHLVLMVNKHDREQSGKGP